MTTVICLETAAPSPMVVLGDDADGVLFADTAQGRVEGPVFLRDNVLRALKEQALAPGEINAVAVDLGPGGLTATRCGVTFANALAWALERPLIALNYLDLVGIESRRLTGAERVLCAFETRPGEGFLAVHENGTLGQAMHGDLACLAARVQPAGSEPVVAGSGTPGVLALFPGARKGARMPSPETLLERALAAMTAGEGVREPLEPLTAHAPSVRTAGWSGPGSA